MRAINHALTGAVIGFAIGEPVLAVPLAFASHFVCDAIPHFGVRGSQDIGKAWFNALLIADFVLCTALVAVLAIFHPQDWLLVAICAFLATSPDLFSAPRFFRYYRKADPRPNLKNYFVKFHHDIQWFERPPGLIVEAAWFVAGTLLVGTFL